MTAMTEEWVLFWVHCLANNFDYHGYCSDRDAGRAAACREYEARFDRIAEIYDDFGAVDRWPPKGLDDPRWKEWIAEHKHLFMPDVQQLSPPIDLQLVPNDTVVLSVPLQPTLDATLNAVREHLIGIYRTRSAPVVIEPKYKLNCKANGNVAVGYEQVRQAVHMSKGTYMYGADGEQELGVHETMIEFLKHEIDALGWTFAPRARALLMNENYLSPESFESFKSRINKLRREGACQDSCRLIHAHRGALSSADAGVSIGSESRSGLSLTTAM